VRFTFGGEVLKFIGDGMLAIFPVIGKAPRGACDAALRAVSAARVGMTHLDQERHRQGLPPLPFGAALHLGECCGAISAPPTVWISRRSAPPSTW